MFLWKIYIRTVKKQRWRKALICIVCIRYWIPVVLSWMAFRELIMWARESVIALQGSRRWRWKLEEWTESYREVNGPAMIYCRAGGTMSFVEFSAFFLISVECGNTTQSLLNSMVIQSWLIVVKKFPSFLLYPSMVILDKLR